MHSNFNDLKTKTMTAKEFREEQNFEYEHFLELDDCGNKPDYYNIEQFAEHYHQAKLKLLGISDVVERSEQFKCYHENHEWISDGDGGNLKYCKDCKCYV